MEFQFCAEIIDFKILCNVLKAITFKEFAVLRPMVEGLKVTVEEMQSIETSAYIPVDLFTSYSIDETKDIKFKISLKILTECLNIFGDDGNPCLKMTYKAPGSPLYIIMTHPEENISVDCEIHTLNVDQIGDISLGDECSLNKIVMNAGQLGDVFSDLDNTSDDLQLFISPNNPFFRIKTTSVMGESQVDISKESEIILSFNCEQDFSATYAFKNIQKILKVMSYANKVSISTGISELLSMSFVINVDDKQMYVEYYVTSIFSTSD